MPTPIDHVRILLADSPTSPALDTGLVLAVHMVQPRTSVIVNPNEAPPEPMSIVLLTPEAAEDLSEKLTLAIEQHEQMIHPVVVDAPSEPS